MAYTVDYSFDLFFEAINLDGDHRETANARRDRIVGLLENHFEILEAFSTGSIPRFTALKNHADLDVMVALHHGKHIQGKTPTQLLQDVRDALAKYRTGVRRNGQAVTLSYETWPDVDIVPVSRVVDDQGNITHYHVPNANRDTWIKSRPKTHSKDVDDKSSKCGKNFRRVIKMLKHWNRIHSDYLQSYHIEVLALTIFSTNMDNTPSVVNDLFEKAIPLLQGPIWHDGAFADEYLDWDDRQEVLKRFDTAASLSRAAWWAGCESNDDQDEERAIELWRQIFGGQFPAYG